MNIGLKIKSFILFTLLCSLTQTLQSADQDNKNTPFQRPPSCNPEVLTDQEANRLFSSIQNFLNSLNIDQKSTLARRLRDMLAVNPYTLDSIAGITMNIPRNQQRFFLEILVTSDRTIPTFISRAIQTYHNTKSSENEQKLILYVLQKALERYQADGSRMYGQELQTVINELVLLNHEDATSLARELNLTVEHSTPSALSNVDTIIEAHIELLIEKFIQSRTPQPFVLDASRLDVDVLGDEQDSPARDFITPRNVLFRNFLRDPINKDYADLTIRNIVAYYLPDEPQDDLRDELPHLRTHIVNAFLLADSDSYITFIIDSPMDQDRFVALSQVIEKTLREDPETSYTMAYQNAIRMELDSDQSE